MEARMIVFAGDSVTDCGRRDDPEGLGFGYVRLLADTPELAGWHVVNAGTGGDRLQDLAGRWQQDVTDLSPDVVSVLIGVNDTWRHFDSGETSDVAAFEERYRSLLAQLETGTRIVLMEPFVVPVDDGQASWRRDIGARIDVVRRLAAEFDATLVPTDAALNAHGARLGAQEVAADGVHPTELGHRRIASAWSEAVRR